MNREEFDRVHERYRMARREFGLSIHEAIQQEGTIAVLEQVGDSETVVLDIAPLLNAEQKADAMEFLVDILLFTRRDGNFILARDIVSGGSADRVNETLRHKRQEVFDRIDASEYDRANIAFHLVQLDGLMDEETRQVFYPALENSPYESVRKEFQELEG